MTSLHTVKQLIIAGDYRQALEHANTLRESPDNRAAHDLIDTIHILQSIEQGNYHAAQTQADALIDRYRDVSQIADDMLRFKQLMATGQYHTAHNLLLATMRIQREGHQSEIYDRLRIKTRSSIAYQTDQLPDRPGCVTIYALINLLGAVILLLAVCGLSGTGGDVVSLLLLVIAIPLGLAIAYGLWYQKEWGRQLTIAMHVLGLGMDALQVFMGLAGVRTIGSVIVSLVVISWFWTNAEYFD